MNITQVIGMPSFQPAQFSVGYITFVWSYICGN